MDGLAGDVTPEQRDHLQTVLRSMNQLGAMVRDPLEATRAESGKIRIQRRCGSISHLATEFAKISHSRVETRCVEIFCLHVSGLSKLT